MQKTRKKTKLVGGSRVRNQKMPMNCSKAEETSKHVTANATLRDGGAHLWRVGACSRWKTMDSRRLGCSGIPQGCKALGDLKAISRQFPWGLQGGGNGGIWTCIYRVAWGSDVVG